MKKLKVCQLFSIGNAHFLVDIDKQVLEEFQRPENQISFIHDMQDKGTHYELRFDPQTNSAAHENLQDNQIRNIEVPQMTALDPLGMSKKYGYSVEQIKGKPDFDVIVDSEALALRRTGKLPLIEISGEPFVVDIRIEELRHAEHWFQNISLRQMDLTADGGHYTAFYNPAERKLADIDPKLLEFPDHVVFIKIPNEIGLDPVATAREYGMDEREVLRRYPIQKGLKAEVIPLSETNIPAMIQRNREALQQEHRENVQRAKPRVRPRF